MSGSTSVSRPRGRPKGSRNKIVIPDTHKDTITLSRQLEILEEQIADTKREFELQKRLLADLEDKRRALQQEIKLRDKRVYEDFVNQIKARGEKIEEALEILRGIAVNHKEGIEY